MAVSARGRLAKIGAMRVLPVAVCWAIFLSAVLCPAQEPTPIGGKWLRSDEIDAPTDQKVVVFTLPADEAELGRSPSFQISCTGDGKVVRARYFADTPLRVTTGDYRHYDDPAMTPRIVIDKKKTIKPIWDIASGDKYAQIDKRTVQALLHAHLLRIHYIDLSTNNFTDTYSPEGLNENALKRACGDNGWFEK